MKLSAGFIYGAVLAMFMAALGGATVAAPISLTGGVTLDGHGISGALHGDLEGNMLTLNESAPTSSLTIHIPDPADVPVDPRSDNGPFCLNFGCTVTLHPNGATDVNLPPWSFDMGGVVDFDAQTAALTAEPQGLGIFATDTTVLTPTFSVVADNVRVGQAVADAAANTTSTILNFGTPTLSVNGMGTWSSIDLGVIGADLTQDGDEFLASLTMDGVEIRGIYSFGADLSFPNPIVDTVGDAAFERIFENAINDALFSSYSAIFEQLIPVGEDLAVLCSTNRRTATSLNLVCTADSTVELAGDAFLDQPPSIPAPATLGVFALGLLGIGFAGMRGKKA